MAIAKLVAIMREQTLSFGLVSSEVGREATPVADGHIRHGGGRGSSPNVGDLVTAELRLVEPLGEGGMGCVWLADHLVLDRRVAVKFLRDHIAHEESARERLRREAAAVSRLRSPHIVDVLGSGDTEAGIPYIVMEVLRGETLQDRVEGGGPLSFLETAEIVRQTCNGLARAHEAGIVHRDIKPDNLFLIAGVEPLVKILDFGIARDVKNVSRVTTTGNVVGTPLFMAPEQMAGIAVLPASDVWSFAVVVYYCLTGKLPYDGQSLASIALAIDRERPIPVSRLVKTLPAAFDAWLGRALAPRYEDRYANAAEMLEAFETYVLAANPPEMPACEGGASWDVVESKVLETPERGRFPDPKRVVETSSQPAPRVARLRAHRVARALLTAAAGALVGSLGIIGVYAGRDAQATPSVVAPEPRSVHDVRASDEAVAEEAFLDEEDIYEDEPATATPPTAERAPPKRAVAKSPYADDTASPNESAAVAAPPPARRINRRLFRRNLGF